MILPHPEHRPVLTDALRAPSAHNAQAWRLTPVTDTSTYELHYDHNDYLPYDPDDRDAYLAMGAYYETLRLAAFRHGFVASFAERFERNGSNYFLGVIELRPLTPDDEVDPLAEMAAFRMTNRFRYERRAMATDLQKRLETLGNVFVDPKTASGLVEEASVLSWKSPRFVGDLKTWMRLNGDEPTGMTPKCLRLGRFDILALRYAFHRGHLSTALAKIYAQRDVQFMANSSAVAVISADDMSPAAVFDAGRRVMRSWTTICGAGWSYHPVSIAIDERPTAVKVAQLTNSPHPMAMYRIGFTTKRAPLSERRDLKSMIRLR